MLYASVTTKVLSRQLIPAKNLLRRSKMDRKEEEDRTKVERKDKEGMDKGKGKEGQEYPPYPSLRPLEVGC